MSLYNMVNGFNPACLTIMPMLGRKQEDYPRFRDCFVANKKEIVILKWQVFVRAASKPN